MKLLPLCLAVTLLPMALHAGKPSPPSMPSKPTTPSTPPAPAMPMEGASMHVMYDAAQLKWGDPPPALERGAKAVVLSGDPTAPGPFVIRLKAPAGYRFAAHWHPTDEHVTIIEGDLTLTMDQGAPGEHAHTFIAGGYALLPAKMHHTASTRSGVTLQLSGMGPFDLVYVNRKDDPRLRAAAK